MDYTSTISNETMNITCADPISEDRNLIKLVEELQQELHDSKLQLQRTKCVKDELELEVEKLESQNNALQKAFQNEKNEIINLWTERVSKLQAILEEERGQSNTEYVELQRKYEELKNRDIPEADVPEDYTIIHEELKTKEAELAELKKELMSSKEAICDLECTKTQLCERIHDLEKELEENKESLKCKHESLQSTLKALEDMKDDKALLSNELAVLKAGPIVDRGRGNSLFSEVDDKRQNLEKKFATLYNKYIEAKKTLAVKATELENLKRENIKFQLLWEEGESKLQEREYKLIESYKEKIKELVQRVGELELKPESPQIVTISDKDLSNMDWIHTIVDQARSEVRELRHALGKKSMEKLFAEENMYLLTAEVTHLKRQTMKNQALIEDLKMKLNSEKSNTTNDTITNGEQEGEKERKQTGSNGKTVRFAVDTKENSTPHSKKEIESKDSRHPQILSDSTNKTSV